MGECPTLSARYDNLSACLEDLVIADNTVQFPEENRDKAKLGELFGES